MRTAGFSVFAGKSLVVGKNKDGYKGLIVCIPTENMALSLVSGADFKQAKKLVAKL